MLFTQCVRFEPSLINVSTRLSIPVALLVLNLLKIFRIDVELTFSRLRFFSRKLNPLQYQYTEGIPNYPIGSRISGPAFLKICKKFLTSFCDCPGRKFFVLRHMFIVGDFLWNPFCLYNFPKLFWFSYIFRQLFSQKFSFFVFNSFRTAKEATNGNHSLCLKSKPQAKCH